MNSEEQARFKEFLIAQIDRRIAELRKLRAYFRAQLRGGRR